jgi:hypothetical protein
MPSYWPLKNGGTRTSGAETTLPTGSFGAQPTSFYYNSIRDIVTAAGSLGPNAVIIASDLHSEASSGDIQVTAGDAAYALWQCVKDTEMSESSTGAYIESTTGRIRFNGTHVVRGFTLRGVLALEILPNDGVLAENVIVEGTNGNFGQLTIGGSGGNCSFRAYGCTFRNLGVQDNSSVHFRPFHNADIEVYNSTFEGSDHVTKGFFDNYGAKVHIFDSDLSEVADAIFDEIGASLSQDDRIDLLVDGCTLNPTATLVSEQFFMQDTKAVMTRSSAVASEASYQFEQVTPGGNVNDETTIYREESVPDSASNTKVSLEAVPVNITNAHRYLSFPLYADYLDLSDSSTNLATIYFVSTATLDDVQVWAELSFASSADAKEFITLSNRNEDVLTTGTTHTTDTGSDWRDGGSPLAGYNEYKMEIDTTTLGGPGFVSIRVGVGTTDTVIFDTTVEFS